MAAGRRQFAGIGTGFRGGSIPVTVRLRRGGRRAAMPEATRIRAVNGAESEPESPMESEAAPDGSRRRRKVTGRVPKPADADSGPLLPLLPRAGGRASPPRTERRGAGCSKPRPSGGARAGPGLCRGVPDRPATCVASWRPRVGAEPLCTRCWPGGAAGGVGVLGRGLRWRPRALRRELGCPDGGRRPASL